MGGAEDARGKRKGRWLEGWGEGDGAAGRCGGDGAGG